MAHRLRQLALWLRATVTQWARRVVAHPLTTYRLRTDAEVHVIARVVDTEVRGEYLELRDIDGRLHVVRMDAVVSCLPVRAVAPAQFRPIQVEGAL